MRVLSEETYQRMMAVIRKVEGETPRKRAAGFDHRHVRRRTLYGKCTAIVGNVATLTPCKAADDDTPNGAAEIGCYIAFPVSLTNAASVFQVDVGEIYAYVGGVKLADLSVPVRGRLVGLNLRIGCEA